MLIEFRVENFRSFRDYAILNMGASADKSLPGNVIKSKAMDKDFLKSALIFGANASGKSNLILALGLLRSFVLKSHLHQKGMKLNYQPFSFDAINQKKPTTFSVVFAHENVRYQYTFAFDSDRIIEEALYHYPEGRKATIFERHGQEFSFTKDRTEQTVISRRTPENALYLSSSVQFNYKKTMPAYDWFQNGLIVLETSDLDILMDSVIEQANKNLKFRKLVENGLKIADFGITGFRGKIRTMGVGDLEGKLPPQILGMMTIGGMTAKERDIRFTHEVKDSHGKTRNFELRSFQESEGTRKLLAVIGPIINSLLEGKTLLVDELDTKMHNSISTWLVDLFHDPKQNPRGAQLIFNTHNQLLLDLSRFRRDQIWFTEKDNDTGASALFCLAEFGERKDRDIQKAYSLGRYGAVPFIASEKVI
jgi:AAA15 family ATPase/GTPase